MIALSASPASISVLPQTIVPAYTARLARSADEIRAAQRLRFEVFNLELNEGLLESYQSGLDIDPFDEVCDHLLVEHAASGQIVGSYRLQTGSAAALNLGYYSEQEFDFAPYEAHRGEMVELGRACVHRDHRHMGVLNLLWRSIAQYALERRARFLIGCSSLTSQDAALGLAMHARLAQCWAEPAHRTVPRPEYALPSDTPPLADCPPPPRLLRAYLAIGAVICGPPAIDRAFQTIDFLTLLDLHALPSAVRERFLERPAASLSARRHERFR